MTTFVIDTNCLIQAHRKHYPMDVVVGFWNNLKGQSEVSTIECIDKVKAEIYQNNDALRQWSIDNLPDAFYKNTDNVIPHYTRLSRWALSMSDHYKPRAIEEFLDADEARCFSYCLCDDQPQQSNCYRRSSKPGNN
jgi:hypothetical protein